jgi:hypothetical protein
MRKRAAVISIIDQPGSTAVATINGRIAATIAPMYGTKRSTIANSPHSGALGTSMAQSPMPMINPNAALRASCMRKRRLSRFPASSMARVVR